MVQILRAVLQFLISTRLGPVVFPEKFSRAMKYTKQNIIRSNIIKKTTAIMSRVKENRGRSRTIIIYQIRHAANFFHKFRSLSQFAFSFRSHRLKTVVCILKYVYEIFYEFSLSVMRESLVKRIFCKGLTTLLLMNGCEEAFDERL